MNIAFTLVSSNVKVGKIPTTVTPNRSCPPSCPLNHANEGGCYAESGPLAIHWKHVSAGNRGDNFDTFIQKIESLPDGQFYRHNVAGDLYGEGETIDEVALERLVKANKGKKGFTYTHKYNSKKNMALIRWANANGFTINLSSNSMAHAELMVNCGAPVCTLLPLEYQRKSSKGGNWTETEQEYKARIASLPQRLEKGNKVVVCPATFKDGVTCDSCRLCQKANRSCVVGFPVHGKQKKKANNIASF